MAWAVTIGVAAAMALTTATAAFGQRPVDERKPAAADGIVEVQNVSGSVKVFGWAEKQVWVKGTLQEGVERLRFDCDGYRTTIEVVHPKTSGGKASADLEIRVPEASRLQIQTVSADAEAAQVSGGVRVESVSGDVRVAGSRTETEVQSVSGEIRTEGCEKRLKLESVSGDVRVGAPSGEVEVSTVSGGVTLEGGTLLRGDLKTVSGDVQVTSGLSAAGALSVNSHSGEVNLGLPADLAADFSVGTFSGDIRNAFAEAPARAGRGLLGGRLSFSTRAPTEAARAGRPEEAVSNRARVTVTTFSGDVTLSKR